MTERILGLAIYWGVWLILPVMVDGLYTLLMLTEVILKQIRTRHRSIPPVDFWPAVSVIVPVYNGEKTLASCLESLRQQNYPQEQMEVIVVDNGSTDQTYQIFQECQRRPFRGQMHWISIAGRGKSYALNAGLHSTSYPYICTLDADTVMHHDALREMVRHFEADPHLGAATGTVEVLPVSPEHQQNRIASLIAECEFQEYLISFWLGRQGQTYNSSLYTLAGAFSFFRREVLLQTTLYDKQTVSEDTKVTFDIRKQFGGARLACIPEAIVYVTPTPSLSELYSQRVRWQRGEMEVAAVYQDLLDPNVLRLRGLVLGRTLLIDHTFIFPRLVWTFLFPALYFFGYPLSLVISATAIIYFLYVLIAAISILTVYTIATPPIRARLQRNWWVAAFIPAYLFVIFTFRLAGSIIALAEPPEWQVQAPWTETVIAVHSLISALQEKLSFGEGGN
ncbi:MAG: TIGR03111 family XrtG-associated glycosyltransferase [Chloroflexota bacterium]|nr:TIGR03111 family XrtG-associated glycosyltransferase [Chloroflexota bacterium]